MGLVSIYWTSKFIFHRHINVQQQQRRKKNVERERLKEMGNMGRRQTEEEEECHLSLSHTSLHSIYPIYPESHILIGILQTDSTPNTLIHNSAKPPLGYLSSNTPTLSLLLVLSLSPSLHQPYNPSLPNSQTNPLLQLTD